MLVGSHARSLIALSQHYYRPSQVKSVARNGIVSCNIISDTQTLYRVTLGLDFACDASAAIDAAPFFGNSGNISFCWFQDEMSPLLDESTFNHGTCVSRDEMTEYVRVHTRNF